MSFESILLMSIKSSATRQMAGKLEPSVMISRYHKECQAHPVVIEAFELTVNSPLSLKTFMHRPMLGTSWITAFRQHLSMTSTRRSFCDDPVNWHNEDIEYM